MAHTSAWHHLAHQMLVQSQHAAEVATEFRRRLIAEGITVGETVADGDCIYTSSDAESARVAEIFNEVYDARHN